MRGLALRTNPSPKGALSESAPARDGVGVVGAEDALADGGGALEEWSA
jgi:hypothetical protein